MVRFLHSSGTPLTEFKDTTVGRLYKGGRPYGLWYGHDLSWVQAMNTIPTWNIRLVGTQSPVPPLPLYEHVFGSTRIPEVKPEDGEVRPLGLPPHYVYELPIPEAAFTTDVSTPSLSSVLRISATTLPDLVASAKEARATWYATQAGFTFQSSYMDINPFDRVWRSKGPTYAAFLRVLGLPPDAPIKKYDLGKKSEVLLKAIHDGTIPMSEDLLDLERGFWTDYMRTTLMSVWGGLDFDATLVPPSRESVLQVPLLKDLDADSGVLFFPTKVLPAGPPHLVAILSGVPVPDAPDGVPTVVFGLTTDTQLRVLPTPSGGRRRRTRRRMLKNPKTLKKRVR
jgi:hypothetical protein